MIPLTYDSIDSMRLKVIEALMLGHDTPSSIASKAGLPQSTVQYHLDDMVAVDLVEKNAVSHRYIPKGILNELRPSIYNLGLLKP
jgi:DNA-binding IclR family transcriptional regulator